MVNVTAKTNFKIPDEKALLLHHVQLDSNVYASAVIANGTIDFYLLQYVEDNNELYRIAFSPASVCLQKSNKYTRLLDIFTRHPQIQSSDCGELEKITLYRFVGTIEELRYSPKGLNTLKIKNCRRGTELSFFQADDCLYTAMLQDRGMSLIRRHRGEVEELFRDKKQDKLT